MSYIKIFFSVNFLSSIIITKTTEKGPKNFFPYKEQRQLLNGNMQGNQ